MPRIGNPPHLLLKLIAKMNLCNSYRQAITFVGLTEDRLKTLNAFWPRSYCFNVDESSLSGPAVLWVQAGAMIEPAVAGDVVVDADDVRRAWIFAKP